VRIDWKHPIVVLVAGSVVSALGFGGKKLYDYAIDRASDLRVAIEHPQQGVQLVGTTQPKLGDQPVFCDTAALTLLLERTQSGRLPITVDGISVSAEPVTDMAAVQTIDPACKVDPFGDRPYGIGKTNVYIITITKAGVSAQYIVGSSENAAWAVSKDNLLIGKGHVQSILLDNKDPLSRFTVFVSSRVPTPYRVFFSVTYDAYGARKKATQPILITGEQP
jgi:hypothetical protein